MHENMMDEKKVNEDVNVGILFCQMMTKLNKK